MEEQESGMFGTLEDGSEHENYELHDENEYAVEEVEDDEEEEEATAICLIDNPFFEGNKASRKSPLHDCQEAESCLMNDVEDCVKSRNDSVSLFAVPLDRDFDSGERRQLNLADPEEKAILDLLDLNGQSHCMEPIPERVYAPQRPGYAVVDDIISGNGAVADFSRMIGSLQVSREPGHCERTHPNPRGELEAIDQQSGKINALTAGKSIKM